MQPSVSISTPMTCTAAGVLVSEVQVLNDHTCTPLTTLILTGPWRTKIVGCTDGDLGSLVYHKAARRINAKRCSLLFSTYAGLHRVT